MVKSDMGIATNVMRLARRLPKNNSTIIITRILPSRKDPSTLRTAVSMKLAWRKMFRWIVIPAGNDAWISSSDWSSRSLSSSVLTFGCLVMPSRTAGLPIAEPVPRFRAGPICTKPSCPTRIGTSLRTVTTVSAIWSNC